MSLTPEQMRIEVAKVCGSDNRWLIVKRGLFYRPNAHGYTYNESEAWILSEQEAEKHVYPHGDEPVTKKRALLPKYDEDLNAMHEAEASAKFDQFQGVHYPHEVFKVVTGMEWKGDMGYFFPMVIRATALQRCEAFLRVMKPELFAQ